MAFTLQFNRFYLILKLFIYARVVLYEDLTIRVTGIHNLRFKFCIHNKKTLYCIKLLQKQITTYFAEFATKITKSTTVCGINKQITKHVYSKVTLPRNPRLQLGAPLKRILLYTNNNKIARIRAKP